MSNKKRLAIIYALLSVVFVCGYLAKPVEIRQANPVKPCSYYQEYQPYMQIAKQIAYNRSYNVTHYNCLNYTMDLIAALKKAGYTDTYKVVGKIIQNGNRSEIWHAWTKTCVYIESQTGRVLSPEYYRENYWEAYVR